MSKIFPKTDKHEELNASKELVAKSNLFATYQLIRDDIPQKTNDNETQFAETLGKTFDQLQQQMSGTEDYSENTFKGIVLLRKIFRLLLQLIIVGVLIGIFVWEYQVTSRQASWSAKTETQNINIMISNCFLNIIESEDNLLNFKYKSKGTLIDQVNNNQSFQIQGVQEDSTTNLTFKNANLQLLQCVIDLNVPKRIQNLNIVCLKQSECILAFGQNQLTVTNVFNATSEIQASMQINIKNIVARYFIYNSFSSGNLFLNHFKIVRADIRMLSGNIALQSTKSYFVNYTSEQNSICSSGYFIVDESPNITECQQCFKQLSVCEYQYINNENLKKQSSLIEEIKANSQIVNNNDESEQSFFETLQIGELPDEWLDDVDLDENSQGLNDNTDIDNNIINFELDEISQPSEDYSCRNSKQQAINIIGNQSNIYVNGIFKIGIPLKQNYNEYDFYMGSIFQKNIFSLNKQSIENIQLFINKSGSADFAARIDVDGHYLLQNPASSHWIFFSNPNYADFSPWWLSTLSGTFLNPEFSLLQVSTSPGGICPWYPDVTSKQAFSIKQLIQSAFNSSVGEAIFIEANNFNEQNETLSAKYYYKGFEKLKIKEPNKYETWIRFRNYANNIIYEETHFNHYFATATALSIISSIIFGWFWMGIFKNGVFALEKFVTQSKSLTQKGLLSEITKKMSEQIDNSRLWSPPILLGISSYGAYVFSQQKKNSPKMFFTAIFEKSEIQDKPNLQQNSSDQEIQQEFQAIPESEIKEQYQEFCFLYQLTVEPLVEYEQLLNEYGFGFFEKVNTMMLSRIKFNPQAKSYLDLEIHQIQSKDSIEIFISTQCLLTGIPGDTIESQIFKEKYLQFCGSKLQILELNFEDLSKQYHFYISDQKVYELRRKSQNNVPKSFIAPIFKSCSKYIPLIEENQHQSQYVLRKKNEINQIVQNPLKILREKKLNSNYNQLRMFFESLKFIFYTRILKKRYEYGEKEDENFLLDFFDAIYMNGWWLTDFVIVAGNCLLITFNIFPLLFFIIVINTSYSPYSIYNPQNLLYMSDVVDRPWSLVDFYNVQDYWVLVLGVFITSYSIVYFIIQCVWYIFSHFPDDVAYIYVYKYYQKKTLKFLNFVQWLLFTILTYFGFCYFGLIIVWLILGAIINPNYYLVYSSSAIALMGFLNSQYKNFTEIYTQAKVQINAIIKDIYLKTFGMIAKTIIKEIQKLNDSSSSILNSPQMDLSRNIASKLGLEEIVNDLVSQAQSMMERAGNEDFSLEIMNFQKIKDKFIKRANEKFLKLMKDQFNIKKEIAQLFININQKPLDDVIDQLAKEIEALSEKKIPSSIIKWFYLSSMKIKKTIENQKIDSGPRYLAAVLEEIALDLLEIIMEEQIFQTAKKNPTMMRVIKILIQAYYSIQKDNCQKNVLKNFKILFEQIKFFPGCKNIQIFQILEIFIDFSIIHNHEDAMKLKNVFVDQVFKILEIDEDVYKMYQILFNYNLENNRLENKQSTSLNQINFIIQFAKQSLNNMDNQNRQKFEFLVTFAISALNREKVPFHEFLQLLSRLKINSDVVKNIQKNSNLSNFFSLYALSCQILISQIQEIKLQGFERQFTIEVISISSKYYWSSELINQSYVSQSINEKRNLRRCEILKSYKIISGISQAFQISKLASTGLILVLQNEIYKSKFHTKIYEELLNSCKQQKESSVKHIQQSIELLSITSFEEISYYLFDQNLQELLIPFVQIVFSSKEMFQIFNGYALLEKIKDQKNQKFIESFMKGRYDTEINKKSNLDIEIVNMYKSGKYLFYTFLKQKSQYERSEEFSQLQKYKFKFFMKLKQTFPIKLEYIYGILQKQQDIIDKNDTCTFTIVGLNQEPFRKLINLLMFSNNKAVEDSMNYFLDKIRKKPVEIKMNRIVEQINKFIAMEKLAFQFTFPDNFPHYFARLRTLFLNQLLQTHVTINKSLFFDFITYFIKYQLPQQKIELNSLKFVLDPIEKYTQDFTKSLDGVVENFKLTAPLITIALQFAKHDRPILIKQLILDLLFANKQNIATYEKPIEQISYEKPIEQVSDLVSNILSYEFYNSLQKLQFKNKQNQGFFYEVQRQLFTGLIIDEQNQKVSPFQNELILSSQRLKYFVCYNKNIFQELTEHYFKVIKNVDKPEEQRLQAFLSLATETPDLKQLQTYFDILEEDLSFASFVVDCIFKEKKTVLLQNSQIQMLIKKRLKINELKPMIDVAEILEDKDFDWQKLLINIKESSIPLAFKLFQSFYSLKKQLTFEKDMISYQKSYNLHYKLRSQIFLTIQCKKLSLCSLEVQEDLKKYKCFSKEIIEILHWFSFPRPLNYILMMKKLKLIPYSIDQESLFCSCIGAVGNYDRFNKFTLKSAQEIQIRTQKVKDRAKISMNQAILYLAQHSDQDLQEAFYFLMLTCGIHPLLTNGIFQLEKGQLLQQNQYLYLLLQDVENDEQQDIYNFLCNFIFPDKFNNQMLINIIELETKMLKSNSEDEKTIFNQQLAQKLGLEQQQYWKIVNFLSSISEEPSKDSFIISQLILLLALKLIREIKKNEKDKFLRYIKGTQAISLAFMIFERQLYLTQKRNIDVDGKLSLVQLFSKGIFGSSELRTKSYMINDKKLGCLLYPIFPQLNELDHQQFQQQYNDIHQFWTDLFNNQLPIENKQINLLIENIIQNNTEKNQHQENEIANQNDQPTNSNTLDKSSIFQNRELNIKEFHNINSDGLNKFLISSINGVLSAINLKHISFIRSKYWDKSFSLLVQQICNLGEQQSFQQDQQLQKLSSIYIGLLEFHSNQFQDISREECKEEKAKAEKQKEEYKQKSSIQFNQNIFLKLTSINNKPKIISKYKEIKNKNQKQLTKFIYQLLSIKLNEHEAIKYQKMVLLLYDMGSLPFNFISNIWIQQVQMMDVILMIYIRKELEHQRKKGKFQTFSRKISLKYLYSTKGDIFYSLPSNQTKVLETNHKNVKKGLKYLLLCCKQLTEYQVYAMVLLLRCFLRDIEAQYYYFRNLSNQEIQKEDIQNNNEDVNNEINKPDNNITEEIMLKQIVEELLLFVKNQGFHSFSIGKDYLITQSFQSLLFNQFRYNLSNKIARISSKIQRSQKSESLDKDNLSKFVQFILNPQQQKDLNFMEEIMKNILKSGEFQQTDEDENFDKIAHISLKILKVILNILNNSDTGDPEILQDRMKQWKCAEQFMLIFHSVSLKEFINNTNMLLRSLDITQYEHYQKYLISFLCLTEVFDQETNQNYEQLILNPIQKFYNIILGKKKDDFQAKNNLLPPIDKQSSFKVFEDYLQLPLKRKQELKLNRLETLRLLRNNFDKINNGKMKEWTKNFEMKIFNFENLPRASLIQIILGALQSNFYGEKLSNQQCIIDFFSQTQESKITQIKKLINFLYNGAISETENIRFFEDLINTIFPNEASQIMEVGAVLFKDFKQDQCNFNKITIKLIELSMGSCSVKNEIIKLFSLIEKSYEQIQQLTKLNTFNEITLLEFLKIISKAVIEGGSKPHFNLKDVEICIDAMIALKNKKFGEINLNFIKLLGLGRQNEQNVVNLLRDFQLSQEAPLQLIQEKMISLANPKVAKTMQYMGSVIAKLNGNQDFEYEDMFKAIDQSGQRFVQAAEILQFLKRINIEITEHKFTEILINVKKERIILDKCQIDFYEFKEIMNQLSEQTIFLSLSYLGLSKAQLLSKLQLFIIYFTILIAFIIIGVRAFSIPGTFASIINSMLPILGGAGINQKNVKDCEKQLSEFNLKDKILKAIKVLQSSRT